MGLLSIRNMPDEIKETFICQYCGTENEIQHALDDEIRQEYIQDCFLCRSPNRIIIVRQPDNTIKIEARIVSW